MVGKVKAKQAIMVTRSTVDNDETDTRGGEIK